MCSSLCLLFITPTTICHHCPACTWLWRLDSFHLILNLNSFHIWGEVRARVASFDVCLCAGCECSTEYWARHLLVFLLHVSLWCHHPTDHVTSEGVFDCACAAIVRVSSIFGSCMQKGFPPLSGYSALLTIQTARVSRGNSRESVTLITWDVGCDQCVVIFFYIFYFFFIRWLLLYPTSDGCLLSSVPFGGNVVCLKHLNKIYQDLF